MFRVFYEKKLIFMIICMVILGMGWTPPAFAKDTTLVLAIGGENTEGYDPILGWGSYGNPLFQSTLYKKDVHLKSVPDLATGKNIIQRPETMDCNNTG